MGRDLAAAALADIAVLEVALRHAMNTRLSELAGRPDWYALDIGLDDRSLRTIAQAWNRLPAQRRTPGRVVAQPMFGFWRDLLEQGGHRGDGPLRVRRSYEDLWRGGMHRAFPGGRAEAAGAGQRFTRAWTLGVVSPAGLPAPGPRPRPRPRLLAGRPQPARRPPGPTTMIFVRTRWSAPSSGAVQVAVPVC